MPSLFDDPAAEPTPQAAPTRLCPHCSTQSQTAGDFCPHCGKSLVRRRRSLGKRGKIAILVATILVVLGGGSTAVAMKVQHDNTVKAQKQRAQRIADAKRVARE